MTAALAPSYTVTTSPAPTYEVGYVNGQPMSWQQWVEEEKVPDLQWPQANLIYARMGREDGRVSSVLNAIGLPIRRTTWRIDPAGARDEVTEFVARNLALPIVGESTEDKALPRTKGRFSWVEHIRVALMFLQYGHSFLEQVYRIEDGKLVLHKLAPRPQRTIIKMNVARDGGLDSIVQAQPADSNFDIANVLDGGVRIPIDRLVAYVRDMDPGRWMGNSLLRPAYKHWLLKDELMRIEAAVARRNGMGVPVAIAPEGADQGTVDAYRNMATEYRGGERSGVGLPNGASFQLLGVQGNLPDIRQAIEYHDKQIALAGLAHFLNLDRGGSYALASVQSDSFTQSTQTIAESIRDTAQAHIVEDLVDLNFGEEEPAPRLVFDEIGSRQDLTAQALKTLIDAGLIRLDRSLEEYTRQQYGLPSKDTPAPGEGQVTVSKPSPEDVAAMVTAAGTLIRSGFDPQDALKAVGLDPIEHLGLLPVTVQKPVDPEGADGELVEDLMEDSDKMNEDDAANG